MLCVCGKHFSINPPERDRAPREGAGRISRDEVDNGVLRIIDAGRDESLIIRVICPYCEEFTLAKVRYGALLPMPKKEVLHSLYGAHDDGKTEIPKTDQQQTKRKISATN